MIEAAASYPRLRSEPPLLLFTGLQKYCPPMLHVPIQSNVVAGLNMA